MKKLIVLFLFIIGLLLQLVAKEKDCTVVKIGKKITIYNYEDFGNSNYWGDKVKIVKTDTILPSDAEAKDMGIPDEEWFAFSEKVNGVYDSRVEKAQKKYLTLENKYQKLLKEKPNSESANEALRKEITTLKARGDSTEKSFNKQIKELSLEKDSLTQKYNKLFAHKTHLEWRISYLVALLIIFSLLILFLILKLRRKNKKLKILEIEQRVSNLS